MQSWKEEVVKKLTGGVAQLLKMNKVEVIKGNAVFKDAKTLEVTGSGGTESDHGGSFRRRHRITGR